MSLSASLLSRLRPGEGKMTSLLPLHTSPPPRASEEHDLDDLSPRPDDALLSPKFPSSFPRRNKVSGAPDKLDVNARDPDHKPLRSKGKGKAIAFAYQEPTRWRSRAPDTPDDDSIASDNTKNKPRVPPGIWRPSIHTEQRGYGQTTAGSHTSFVDSVFLRRPDRPSDRAARSDVDNTFKLMQRREHQMEKELQKLLDAQGAALQRELDGTDAAASLPNDAQPGRSPSSATSTAHSKLSGASVVPVRQPKKKPMSKRQARVGIARSVTMLADLKNEEDAYIAAALAERKTALSKLRSLSSQRSSIAAEMRALEEDRELPIRAEIATMEGQRQEVCANIDVLEEKLRILKRTKAELERKLEEAKSIRDASLSGYKGALRQCDQGIADLMKYPGIRMLEADDIEKQTEDTDTLLSKRMSGFEFLSLRPERRTTEMAKDWWEGEVAVLEQRKAAVDKERAALEEGNEMWQQVVDLVSNFEGTLHDSLQVVMKNSSEVPNPDIGNPESILQEQYEAIRRMLRELIALHDYAESKGWKLLIAAIGAEVAHFIGVKDFLAATIRSAGYDDRSITPVHAISKPSGPGGASDLVDVRENGGVLKEYKDDPEEDEELSRSVVRRWDDIHDNAAPAVPAGRARSASADLLGASDRGDESDNEVPPGLLGEALGDRSRESVEDDVPSVNEVPSEFLSMHSPPRGRDRAAEGYERRARVRRESSVTDNAVPPDLLAESRPAEDGDPVD
ncbi:hypothetical protein GGS23DRAFT_589986 [Durotheca rogersii]|uniref:uncharacterized protein n=1 Tax=Durotheca rogersii TaxID=419775 RepID=UPI00221F315C|nr:uncharacterized protein GGS23DRAFT_589986 [Durotheca rogersii]KAI5855132.1 hypothetical protein GGS23DRAFT_589986 [Durotheca rogersii]